jgi:predicted N-acetyltransferase YhbS
MTLRLRKGVPADAAAAGDVCYRAFKAIAEAHRFPPDFPSPELAAGLLQEFLEHERFFTVVAEVDGRLVGSNFMDERSPINGIGPITVDPSLQNEGAGHALMEAALRRSRERGSPGVRLVQAGYHNRSLALYLKLGFQVREPLVCLQGAPLARSPSAASVRSATRDDLPACNQLCMRVHGHDRGGELADAVAKGTASVVTLMTIGLYNPPDGAWLPSVTF